MSVTTGKYTVKALPVEAVQITATNIVEVAKWCGGTIKKTRDLVANKMVLYIELDVPGKKTGFVGEWVSCFGTGFRIHPNRSFRESFQPSKSDEERYAEILQVVQAAMDRQDTEDWTFYKDQIAEDAAKKILKNV